MTTKPLTPQQREYKKTSDNKKNFQRLVNQAAAATAAQLSKSRPEFASFAVKPLNVAYIRGKSKSGKVIQELAKITCEDATGNKTKASLVQAIQPQFPEYSIPANIWSRQLSPALFRKIEDIVQSGLFYKVSIRGCKTLAEVKDKLKASIKMEAAVKTYKPKVAVSRDSVVVNDVVYPVAQRNPKDKTSLAVRVTVAGKKRQWIRLDALVTLLSSN